MFTLEEGYNIVGSFVCRQHGAAVSIIREEAFVGNGTKSIRGNLRRAGWNDSWTQFSTVPNNVGGQHGLYLIKNCFCCAEHRFRTRATRLAPGAALLYRRRKVKGRQRKLPDSLAN